MEVLEYDHNVFNAQQNEADKALLVRFHILPLHNEAKSLDAGRPIFDDTEMVEIRVRGTKDNIVIRPVLEHDKRRFRDAYVAYKDGNRELNSGTPLKQWPAMSASMVEEFRYLGFQTVEQLVSASDATMDKVGPGMRTIVMKAKAFMELSKGSAPIERMQAQITERENELETTKRQLTEVSLRMAGMEETIKEMRAGQQVEAAAKVPTRK